MSRTGLEKPYASVLAAVRTYVADAEVVTNTRALYAVAEALGGDGEHPGETFYGQLKRALNALVAEGTLVKVPRGEMRPSKQGWYYANEPYYFQSDDYDGLVVAADQAAARQAAHQAALDALVARASAAGIDAEVSDNRVKIDVDPDAFRLLLDAYEAQKGATS